MRSPDDWLRIFARLNVYRAKGGKAPHKPILLLVVIDLAELGELLDGGLELTPEIAFRFFTYWPIVAHRRTQKPDVRLPFFHLASDACWESLDREGRPALNSAQAAYARLPPDLVACLRDPDFRARARRVLIESYFPAEEQAALCTMLGLPIPEDIGAGLDARLVEEAKKQGCESRFRLEVVAAYEYACALTGHRLTTVSAGSIVDAAHIHRFADSRNNAPDNGIALSKTSHWLFDNGLWSLDDHFKVIVAGSAFNELCPNQKPLHEYHGQSIRLPRDRTSWPNPEHLAWHRRHVFVGA
jgi:putative restriction endonuclease